MFGNYRSCACNVHDIWEGRRVCRRPKKETALELLRKCHSKLKVSSIAPKHLLLQESYGKL